MIKWYKDSFINTNEKQTMLVNGKTRNGISPSINVEGERNEIHILT